jgi:hypothetical protein
MEKKTIMILGGYGNTGLPIARLLLTYSSTDIVIAGRNLNKAEATAAELNTEYDCERINACRVDASSPESLVDGLIGIDLLVVASSTAQYADLVARAAINCGSDYFDVQYSTGKLEALRSLQKQIEERGLCFITDGGFHPGLPAALVRYGAASFDRLNKAVVGSVIQINWSSLEFSSSTIDELVSEFANFKNLVFKDGKWQPGGVLSWIIPRWFVFPHGFGRRYCVPMYLEEMRPLPERYPDLAETGFYVGGFNWFTDWFITPLTMFLPRIFKASGMRLSGLIMEWSLKKFSRPPYGTLLKLEAEGLRNSQEKALEVSVFHQDGYALTAIPATACILQYLDGTIRSPGLFYQALAVEPARFINDMQRMGAEITRREK